MYVVCRLLRYKMRMPIRTVIAYSAVFSKKWGFGTTEFSLKVGDDRSGNMQAASPIIGADKYSQQRLAHDYFIRRMKAVRLICRFLHEHE